MNPIPPQYRRALRVLYLDHKGFGWATLALNLFLLLYGIGHLESLGDGFLLAGMGLLGWDFFFGCVLVLRFPEYQELFPPHENPSSDSLK